MTEGLFILTTIFVAYVVYVIVNEPKTTTTKATVSGQVPAEPLSQPALKVVAKQEAIAAKPIETKTAAPLPIKSVTPPAKKSTKTEAKPTTKATATLKSVSPASKPAVAANSVRGGGLKDPATGEVAAPYSNYRFTKRWIKDALVLEGLLPKVYKNAELDPAIEAQIKDAVIKLESLDKYKA